jgi:hypothetical protein
LGSEWTRSELSQGKTFQIVFFTDPATILNQVLLHVPGKSDRATESDGSEPQEISDELRHGSLRDSLF